MARKAMSTLDVAAWVNVWKDKLEGARLDNIYKPEGVDGLLLKFKWPGGQALVVAEPSVRIHETWRLQAEREVLPRGLVAVARKHVRGLRVSGLRQAGFDKIVEIEFHNGARIVVELLPRGIIAVVSSDGRVMGLSSTIEAKDRIVKPGLPYKLPPLRRESPFEYNPEELMEGASKGKDVVRGLIVGAQVPPEAAEEALHRCGIPKELKPLEVGLDGYRCVRDRLQDIFKESMEGKGYIVFDDEGKPAEADPFRPLRFERVRSYPTLDEALDEYFALARTFRPPSEDPEVARLKRSIEEARALTEEYMKRAEELRKAAEAVASRYEEVDRALRSAWKGVIEGPIVEASRAHVILNVGGVRVKAYRGEDAGKLILRLYKEAGEMEAKARRAREAWRSAEEKLREALLRAKARSVASAARSRRRLWFERYHWTITRNGLLAIGGRDAGQNESIVKRYLGRDDVFMHADVHGAPAVVIKTRGEKPSEGDLRDAAVIAVAYSKAWKSGVGSVSVYWVMGSQVSLSPPAGEYLPHGGVMVYGKRSYIHGVEVALYLGVTIFENASMVIVGGEDVVKRYSIAYVKLAPGETPRSEPRVIKESLAKVLPEDVKHLVLGVPEEEVEDRLPGRYRVLRAARGEGRTSLFSEAVGLWT